MGRFCFDFFYLLVYDFDMPKYIDAHCHIITPEQMQNAMSCGVGRFVINATRPADWSAVTDLANNDNVYGAIGIHPWFVANLDDDWSGRLIDLLQQNTGLMVGEIGLDKNHDLFDIQESVFRRGLEIAHDMKRIAHIHCVGTWGKMMDVLRSVDLPPAMVFHAFSGAAELIPELVQKGAYFSFGLAVCDTKRTKLRESVAVVPENRILVESDAPDGGMPDTIPETVREIARIRGVQPEQMANIIYNNTMGLLNDKSV